MLPLLALLSAFQDPIAFVAAGPPIPVGPMAGRPLIADMNGDGRPDLLVACGTCCGSPADPDSGHIVVLLGDGSGGFSPAAGSPLRLHSSTRKIAVGDLDRDGRPDVVAASHDTNDVYVLLGDGRGGLRPAPVATVPLGGSGRPHTHEVALGDVDRDGRLDLLATQADDHCVAILRGDGAGGFAPATHVPIARHPYDALVLADVDGDQRPDLVVPDLFGAAVSVSLQDAAGGFGDMRQTPQRQFPVGKRPGYLVVTDLNRDGDPDIVVTHDDSGQVALLLGDGDGGFAHAPGSPRTLPGMLWGIAAADFDGDQQVDLAFGSMLADTVLVARGDGRGGLSPAATCRAGSQANYVAAGDLDGDGKPDLVASSYADGTLTVLLNRSAASARDR